MYKGLTSSKAQELFSKFGPNEIKDSSKSSPLKILLRQIQNNMIVYLLSAAAVLSFVVGKDISGFTILAVILSVIVIGFYQEYRAEEAILSLKKMITPTSRVIRDGIKSEVPAGQLVPGDLILLSNGEKIPADSVVVDSYELRVNESALTGEFAEVTKIPSSDISGGSEESKVYMGTYVVNGRCMAVVQHTGMNTKFGNIAHMISSAEKELPLQKKINFIAKYMIVVSIVASLTAGLLILVRSPFITQEVLIDIMLLMVAIAVSAFPEGFPVVLISSLAAGAKRMSQKNAIVNRMSIIETLGETTIICSDKTGTITKGEMTAKMIFCDDEIFKVTGTGYSPKGEILLGETTVSLSEFPTLRNLLKAAVVCNDSHVDYSGGSDEVTYFGTPTEISLKILGLKSDTVNSVTEYRRIDELPFNSDRKLMSVLCQTDQGLMVFAKGAPEVLIRKCAKVVKNGKIVKIDSLYIDKVLKLQKEMASNAFRTLALAYKTHPGDSIKYQETDLIFLGMVCLEDPPREEVPLAIQTAKSAGIRVVMITGDNKDTAVSVAKEIGLDYNAITGDEIDKLTDEELTLEIKDKNLFVRVKPEHKIRIVKLLKQQGEIVAMTGDGVNDAPALKEAHIGIAMGKNGTDVSRSAADLTLKDDNFATIVVAISEGRTVFNNIRKFVTYQLSRNLSELVTLFISVLIAPVFGWPIPFFVSIHILLLNLITDNIPAVTLGLNPSSSDIMLDPPRKNPQLLNKSLIKLLVVTGFLMSLIVMVSFYLAYNILNYSEIEARSIALFTMILLGIGSAFNFRSFRKQSLNRSIFVNKYLTYASLLSLSLTLAILYTPLNSIFETTEIGIKGWVIAICLSFTSVLIQDLIKWINLKDKTYLGDIS